MLQNYLKVAIRTLLNNKAFSFINIAGLAIGISTCILMTLYVMDELSYDRYHEKSDRIYRVTELLHLPKEVRPQTVTSPPIAPWLKDNFAEIEHIARISFSQRSITYGDRKFDEARTMFADSTLFNIFTYPMLKGNPSSALNKPYSIVLTEKAAQRYFGDEDPMDKTMSLSDTITLTVTGVVRDVPDNSHFFFDLVMSRSTLTSINNNGQEDNWFNNNYYTYMLLREAVDYRQLETKIQPALHSEMEDSRKESGVYYDFVLQPLTDIHLRSTTPYDISPNGNIKYVYTFGIVALLVLVIACANYINLSTARSLKRAKEVGMRKAVGARRFQLMSQLLGESLVVTSFAFVMALLIINLCLPWFNELTSKQIKFLSLFTQPSVVGIIVFVFLVVGVLAGSYPALLISGYSPIASLKSSAVSRERGVLRKGLVVFQFTISIMLVGGTMIIFRQLEHMRNEQLGLNKDQMLMISLDRHSARQHEILREEMSKIPGVQSATVTSFNYGSGIGNIAAKVEGSADNEITSEATISVDYEFIPTLGISLLAGRNFSRDVSTDASEGFIVNESAVKHFNWGTPEQAIGKSIDWGLGKKGKVVGVVKDFNFESLHTAIVPLVMHIYPEWYGVIGVKARANSVQEVVAALEKGWKKISPESAFNYTFLDQQFRSLYKAEQQSQFIIGLFSSLAIFIACLGLFGLAAFMAEQRTKEIGIRKVLGAGVGGIVRLLSKDFVLLVLIAIVIATPITWYAMNKWLDTFAYKTDISWLTFALAGGLALLTALLTVSYESIRVAMVNPVDSLKNE